MKYPNECPVFEVIKWSGYEGYPRKGERVTFEGADNDGVFGWWSWRTFLLYWSEIRPLTREARNLKRSYKP